MERPLDLVRPGGQPLGHLLRRSELRLDLVGRLRAQIRSASLGHLEDGLDPLRGRGRGRVLFTPGAHYCLTRKAPRMNGWMRQKYV